MGGVIIVIQLKEFLNFHLDFIFDPMIIQERLFNFHVFAWFWGFLLELISSFITLWSQKVLDLISVFLVLRLILWPIIYGLSWRKFHTLMNRIYILWLLARMFCKYLLSPFVAGYSLHSLFLYWFSVLMTCLVLSVEYWSPPLLLCCCLAHLFHLFF